MTQIALDLIKTAPQTRVPASDPPAAREFADRLASASTEPVEAVETRADEPATSEEAAPPEQQASVDQSYDRPPGEEKQEPNDETGEATGETSEQPVSAEAPVTAQTVIELHLNAEVVGEGEAAEPTGEEAVAADSSPEPIHSQQESNDNADEPERPAIEHETAEEEALANQRVLAAVNKDPATVAEEAKHKEAGAETEGDQVNTSQPVTEPKELPPTETLPQATDAQQVKPSVNGQQPPAESPEVRAESPLQPTQETSDQSASGGDRQRRRGGEATQSTKSPATEAPLETTPAEAEAAGETTIDAKPTTSADARADAARPDTAGGSIERITDRLTSARSVEPQSPSLEERVDAARFVSRVSRAFESAQQQGDVVRLRLSPPELGAMQIKLSLSSEGAMTASVETETAAARNVLLDNLPALRERLEGMQIRVEKFDVNVGQEGGGQQDWRPDQRGERQPHGRAPQSEPTQEAADTNPTADTAGHASLVGADQINLVI